MAITEAYAGTESVGTTEHSITTDTAGPDVDTNDGVYQVWLDVSDMVAGDELQIRGYEKVQSTDTQRVFFQATLIGAQSQLWVSPSFILLHGWDFTLDCIAGTNITVTWSVRKVA
jgi:hypothetical protein